MNHNTHNFLLNVGVFGHVTVQMGAPQLRAVRRCLVRTVYSDAHEAAVTSRLELIGLVTAAVKSNLIMVQISRRSPPIVIWFRFCSVVLLSEFVAIYKRLLESIELSETKATINSPSHFPLTFFFCLTATSSLFMHASKIAEKRVKLKASRLTA